MVVTFCSSCEDEVPLTDTETGLSVGCAVLFDPPYSKDVLLEDEVTV